MARVAMAAVPELLQQQEEDRSKVRPFSLSGCRTGGPADFPKPHISSPGALGLFMHPCLAVMGLPRSPVPREAPAGLRVAPMLCSAPCGPWEENQRRVIARPGVRF